MTHKTPNTEGVEGRQRPQYVDFDEEGISLAEYSTILRPKMLKIIGFSLAIGIATLAYLFTKPNLYRASATITPAVEDLKQNPAVSVMASFGISVGGPTNLEDLEALFKSHDLSVRVFQKYNYWPTLLGSKYDTATKKIRIGWIDKVLWARNQKAPGEWDAIRAAKNDLRVSMNKKSGNLVVSFECRSAKASARIVEHYLEEAKSRLQEEALDRATKNKRFIEEQITRTVDALTRERLYALLGHEMEQEMMARNREQFGFRVIDSPRVPDRKSNPKRLLTTIVVFCVMFFAVSFYFVIKGKGGVRRSRNFRQEE